MDVANKGFADAFVAAATEANKLNVEGVNPSEETCPICNTNHN